MADSQEDIDVYNHSDNTIVIAEGSRHGTVVDGRSSIRINQGQYDGLPDGIKEHLKTDELEERETEGPTMVEGYDEGDNEENN